MLKKLIFYILPFTHIRALHDWVVIKLRLNLKTINFPHLYFTINIKKNIDICIFLLFCFVSFLFYIFLKKKAFCHQPRDQHRLFNYIRKDTPFSTQIPESRSISCCESRKRNRTGCRRDHFDAKKRPPLESRLYYKFVAKVSIDPPYPQPVRALLVLIGYSHKNYFILPSAPYPNLHVFKCLRTPF